MKKFIGCVFLLLTVIALGSLGFQVYRVNKYNREIATYNSNKKEKEDNNKKIDEQIKAKEDELNKLKEEKKGLIEEREEWLKKIKEIKES